VYYVRLAMTYLDVAATSSLEMLLVQQNIAQSFQSPIVRIALGIIACGLLYVLWREVRKIPAKLFTLMRRPSWTWSGC